LTATSSSSSSSSSVAPTAASAAATFSIPEESATADPAPAGELLGGAAAGMGLRKRAQSLAATMFNLQDLQLAAAARNNNGNNGISVSIAKLQCTDWNCCCCSWRSGRERRRASMQDAIDASKINADLYSKLRRNFGQLNFSLEFREETGILSIRIIQAIDLQPKDSSTGLANPYCRVAPEFEEEFIFELKPQDINWSVLEITVFDYDPCSMDECLGQVKLPLVEVDFSEKQVLWKAICSMEKITD
uniref:C2 domain-containing protein n=1 Tax=Macrostomum lignano TaxID=282301 RepID=A0A1I8F2E1_9PLAT